jgi:hypothetical protein
VFAILTAQEAPDEHEIRIDQHLASRSLSAASATTALHAMNRQRATHELGSYLVPLPDAMGVEEKTLVVRDAVLSVGPAKLALAENGAEFGAARTLAF